MSTFHAQREKKTLEKLEEIKTKLPGFCGRFFLGISQNTAPLTRLNYAYDLRIFFDFLEKEGKAMTDIKDLEQITSLDIELFADYLNSKQNHEHAKSRKISTLRSFFKYFFKHGEISRNVASNVDVPKIHEKPILRLEADEVQKMLHALDDEESLTEGQKRFQGAIQLRDATIITMFLTTGIRISELVGLDIHDIDLKNESFKVTRKGGNSVILYMPKELKDQLELYMMSPLLSSENCQLNEPLFKSLQNKRISIRAVQNLVAKYAQIAAPLKKISPHKLRSTFGTNLYRATGDIYVVAEVLGHRDVNTTKKHYAAQSEDIKRAAAQKIKLDTRPKPD